MSVLVMGAKRSYHTVGSNLHLCFSC